MSNNQHGNRSSNGQARSYFSRKHGRVIADDLWFLARRKRNRVRDRLAKIARRKNRGQR